MPIDFASEINPNGRLFWHEIVEFNHVAVFKTDAAVAGTPTDAIFAVCPVDIDVALLCIGVTAFYAIKAQDSSEDQILISGCAGFPVSHRRTCFKNRAEFCFLTDFFANEETSNRRFEAALLETYAKFGTASWPGFYLPVAIPQGELLAADGNFDSWAH